MERTPLVSTQAVISAHDTARLVFQVALLTFVITFSSILTHVPTFKLYEDIICRNFYETKDGRPPDYYITAANFNQDLCKRSEIQEELVAVTGGMEVTAALIALFLTIPYSSRADSENHVGIGPAAYQSHEHRVGRKYVIRRAMVGVILSHVWTAAVCWYLHRFTLRLVWISPLFQIIGGGGAVIESMMYTITSDLSNEAIRARIWFHVESSALIAELVAWLIGSMLMKVNPWVPMRLGLVLLIPSTALIGIVRDIGQEKGREPSGGAAQDGSSTSYHASSGRRIPLILTSALSGFRSLASEQLQVILLYITFLAQVPNGETLVVGYMSTRFSWPIEHATFLLSMQSAFTVILYLCIFPLVSMKFPSGPSADLYLATLSLTLQILGGLFVASSALPPKLSTGTALAQSNNFSLTLAIGGLAIYTLGMGFDTFCRSHLARLVRVPTARLHSIIVVIETIGSIIATPIFSRLFSWGVSLAEKTGNSGYLGLPFLGIVSFTILTGSGVIFVLASQRRF